MRHFVEFYLKNKKTVTYEVSEEQSFETISIPKDAMAYCFFDRVKVNNDVLEVNVVPKTKLEVYSVFDFEKNFPELTAWIALFRRKGWKYVAKVNSEWTGVKYEK